MLTSRVFHGPEPMRYAGVTMCAVFLVGLPRSPVCPGDQRQAPPRIIVVAQAYHASCTGCQGSSFVPLLHWQQAMAANALNAAALNELTDHRGVRECLQWFTREKQWINETHLQLCRVPAPTFMEQERAAWFHDQFRSLGWNSSIDRAGNVIAASGDGPYVALTAHLDTVIAPRYKDDISVAADGRFQGPGVSDNGAGLAALLAVARVWKTCTNLPELAARPAPRRQCRRGGRRQPAGHAPPLQAVRTLRARSNLLSWWTAPAPNTSPPAALGSRRFEVTFTGPGGHSWSDYGVGNPVHALCRAVAFFSETRLEGLPKSATNVGLIEGGSSVNAIAQTARAKVDIRSESNARMDELVELLTPRRRPRPRYREPAGHRRQGVTSSCKEIGSRPAAALPDQAPILQYLRTVDAHLGIRAHLDTSSTDANIPLVSRDPRRRHRRRRGRRRCPHHPGMVPSRRPRPRSETDSPYPLNVDAQLRNRRNPEVNRRKADLGLLFNTMIWGATFVLVKSALNDISPILFLALRFTLAALALLILLRGRAGLNFDWKTVGSRFAGRLLPVCRVCSSDVGASPDHRSEVGVPHRADLPAGTFARLSRL